MSLALKIGIVFIVLLIYTVALLFISAVGKLNDRYDQEEDDSV